MHMMPTFITSCEKTEDKGTAKNPAPSFAHVSRLGKTI